MYLRPVLLSLFFAWTSLLTVSLVPLATLISATRPPSKVQNAILSSDGLKRYFVTHGGLFSKDGITLDEIRKIKRIGRQPGTEGLMCTFLFMLMTARELTRNLQARFVLQTLHHWRFNTEQYHSSFGRTHRKHLDGDQVNA